MKFEFVTTGKMLAVCPLYDKPIDVECMPYRACGNTTRIVDRVIDILFKGFTVKVQDHIAMHPKAYDKSVINKMNERTLEIVLNRLASEHQGCNIYINKKECMVCIANLPNNV